jgi:hypothetical protein
MLRKVLFVTAGICLGASGLKAQMMQIPTLRGAPFQAVNSVTITDSRGQHLATQKVARASDGSVYQEQHQLDTDVLVQIYILDVPGKRSIRLDPIKKYYIIQDLPSLVAKEPVAGGVAEQIKQAQEAKPTHQETGGLAIDIQPLGKKEIEGLAVLGELETRHKIGTEGTAFDASIERWTSPDLQIALRMRTHNGAGKTDVVDSVSKIQRGEPDPSFFVIPADYVANPSTPPAPVVPTGGTTPPAK